MAVRITRVPPKLITSETNNHHKIVGIALHKEFNREFTINFKTANDIQHYLKTIAERESYGIETIEYGYYGTFRWVLYDKQCYAWGVVVFLGVTQQYPNTVKCIAHTEWDTHGFGRQVISPGLEQITREFTAHETIKECDTLTHYYYECPLFWSQRMFNPDVTQNLTCFHRL